MKPREVHAVVLSAMAICCGGLWGCGLGRPRPPLAAIEAHSEALVLWLERGVRDATLVHIDVHDDLRAIRPDQLAAIEALAALGDLDALRRADSLAVEGLYHEGNFLRAAFRLGIVRDVVWVIPSRIDDGARAVSSGAERGAAAVPLKICTLETMPDFPEPVLLSIDLDFVPEFARKRNILELEAAQRLIKVLGKRAPRRLHVVMSYSTGDGYTPILLRWLGDAVLDMLRAHPSAPSRESRRLWAFLERAEGLRRTCEYVTLLKILKADPSSVPGGPAPLLYLADAYYLRDEVEFSFEACREACLLDKRAAGIFFWVGKGLAIEGRVDEAARFMDAGRKANPAARDWQADAFQALALGRAGREIEALAILERLSTAYTSYSAEFLIGRMLLEKGDRPRAERHFDVALGRLESQPELEVDLPEVREAVVSAAGFYESIGQPEKAGRVRKDVRFSEWFYFRR